MSISESLAIIRKQIEEASTSQSPCKDVTLVAVSKTKPKEMIIEAYNCGCRHFGENYVIELFEKASDPELQELCPDIKWHFIGHLQSNKVNKLLSVPNLHMLQTVDSEKLADTVDKSWSKVRNPTNEPLRVMVQVNVSEEATKSGTATEEAMKLVQHVVENCKNLKLAGLMTIGAPNHDEELGPNPDYQKLVGLKKDVLKVYGEGMGGLELSMGMSDDFVHAIQLGSTCVRVGSRIFGARNYKKE